MRALIQRVSSAAVAVDGKMTGEIGRGLLVFLGIKTGDTDRELQFVADKCVNLRVFEDGEGKMNRSLLDITGDMLVVSQFTLYGDTRKGRRPGFSAAADPAVSEPLYDRFVDTVRTCGVRVATGVFGAHMDVSLVNDGPVTLLVEK
ncbi:MAG: D-aminoacyl-tRNA deacylase [Lentisphaeria bacterium]|nr:D-aminoacyl-tRNA deacylase [Lentisphaeria bacterium]